MEERYGCDFPNANVDPFAIRVIAEYVSIPVINTLDEYAHFHEQLKRMRARSEEYYPERFAMELAVLMHLREYCQKIGLPKPLMPHGDGEGGLVERSPVPDEWMVDRCH